MQARLGLSAIPATPSDICARKRGYDSFGEALTALRWLREEEGDSAAQARVYRCPCSKWHITSGIRSASRVN